MLWCKIRWFQVKLKNISNLFIPHKNGIEFVCFQIMPIDRLNMQDIIKIMISASNLVWRIASIGNILNESVIKQNSFIPEMPAFIYNCLLYLSIFARLAISNRSRLSNTLILFSSNAIALSFNLWLSSYRWNQSYLHAKT